MVPQVPPSWIYSAFGLESDCAKNQVLVFVASGVLEKGQGGFVGGWLRGLKGCFVIWPCRLELVKRELPVSIGQQCQRYNNAKDGGKLYRCERRRGGRSRVVVAAPAHVGEGIQGAWNFDVSQKLSLAVCGQTWDIHLSTASTVWTVVCNCIFLSSRQIKSHLLFRQLPTVTAGRTGGLHLLPTTPQYLRKSFVSEQECLFGLEMQLQPRVSGDSED